MDADSEQYILLVLADGNLPTGSFVASSGLESYAKHGFCATQGSSEDVLDFARYTLESYAYSSVPFATDAHTVVSGNLAPVSVQPDVAACLKKVVQLDALYDAMTLNHVARRASKAQGVALLTLFSKGFTRPSFRNSAPNSPTSATPVDQFVDALKLEIRRGSTQGHLPICWGVLTAALGLSLERSQYLHLFLQARGLLSAAIRMNLLGPYASQQLLLHAVRPLVESQMARCRNARTGISLAIEDIDGAQPEQHLETTLDGPANTWPLGEILATRHDLQHSRIFNS